MTRRMSILVTLAVAAIGLVGGSSAPAALRPLAVAPGLGTPMSATPGQVTISLSGPSYRLGESIRVTVANGLSRTIYTEDMKSDCSIVRLERWSAGEWQEVSGCAMRRAPIVVAIGPGHGRMVTLNPMSIHFLMGKPASSGPALAVGRYRIKFTYRDGVEPEGTEPRAAYSPQFGIAL